MACRLQVPLPNITHSLYPQLKNPSRDTAYIYIGGLPFDLSEGDVLTIFSQFGEPTYINLIRDKESGKSKGFAFLKYEDQRSTDLAVDNLGGASVMGRVLKIDHTRYKRKDGEEDEERERNLQGAAAGKEEASEEESEVGERRAMIKEEVELQKLIRDHDEDDPMKEYLVQEKREEVTRALARLKGEGEGGKGKKEHRHRHHHRRHGHGRDHKERRRSDTDGERDDGRRPGRGDGHRRGHRRRSRSP